MYFACNIEGQLLDGGIESKKLLFDSHQKAIRQQLKDYLSPDRALNGDAIMQDCFPQINDVNFFISHSHKDEAIAIQLANIIWGLFNMKSFIDSMVWDYAEDLLVDIDDEYSILTDNPKVYNYHKVGLSASYVHMMLATSLTGMMDKCDCIIFINTPNSINPSEIKHSSTTCSPWIFHELSMIQFLKVKEPKIALEHFSQRKIAAAAHAPLQMHLPTKVNELATLKYEHLLTVSNNIESLGTLDNITRRIIVMNELETLVCKNGFV